MPEGSRIPVDELALVSISGTSRESEASDAEAEEEVGVGEDVDRGGWRDFIARFS